MKKLNCLWISVILCVFLIIACDQNDIPEMDIVYMIGHVNDYGNGCGDIKIENAYSLPFWVNRYYPDNFSEIFNIDGIELIQNYRQGDNYKDWFPVEYIIRITSLDSFDAFLTLKCNNNLSCSHCDLEMNDYYGQEKKENLLKKYDHSFFETKDIIIASLINGCNTIGLNIDDITEAGVIKIKAILKGKPGDMTSDVAYIKILSIDIEKDFIPDNISISLKSAYLKRK